MWRLVKPRGRWWCFCQQADGISVMALGVARWLLNDAFRKNVRLHPREPSLLNSLREAAQVVDTGGVDLTSYDLGRKDLFV